MKEIDEDLIYRDVHGAKTFTDKKLKVFLKDLALGQ